ncbi:MAG: hypothetical protein WC197_09675, partial [Candidatus Gastranaerophilaceae bacterium]
INKTSNGISTQKEIMLNNNVIFPYAIKTLISNNLNKNQFNYFTLDPNIDFRLINVFYEKVKNEPEKTSNNELLYQFKISIDLLPNLSNNEWYNSKGMLIKKYSTLFDTQESLVPKKQLEVCENNASISFKNLIPVDTYINNAEDVQQITYKITTNADVSEELFITDDRQRVIQTFNDIVFVKVGSEKTAHAKYKYPVNSKGLSKYLLSGPFIKTSSAKIQEIAKELSQKN